MWLLMAACAGDDNDSGKTGHDHEDHTNTNDTGSLTSNTTETGFPGPPAPFTLAVTGAETFSLTFDTPTCTQPTNSTNFSMFWRGKDHVFVLVAQMLGTYTGTGSYDGSAVTVKLQEEAGGHGYYFASEATDTTAMDLEAYKKEGIDGSFNFDGLSGGKITATPMPIPVWCALP